MCSVLLCFASWTYLSHVLLYFVVEFSNGKCTVLLCLLVELSNPVVLYFSVYLVQLETRILYFSVLKHVLIFRNSKKLWPCTSPIVKLYLFYMLLVLLCFYFNYCTSLFRHLNLLVTVPCTSLLLRLNLLVSCTS
jgi:hypothetical protein